MDTSAATRVSSRALLREERHPNAVTAPPLNRGSMAPRPWRGFWNSIGTAGVSRASSSWLAASSGEVVSVRATDSRVPGQPPEARNPWSATLSMAAGSGATPVFSASRPRCTSRVASPPSSRIMFGPSLPGQRSACSVHHQYSSSVSPFHAKTGVPFLTGEPDDDLFGVGDDVAPEIAHPAIQLHGVHRRRVRDHRREHPRVVVARRPELDRELLVGRDPLLQRPELRVADAASALYLDERLVAGLALLGVPAAGGLGLIAGLLDIIPMIGPIIAGIPAVLLAFTDTTRLHAMQRELESAQENLENSIEELQSANEELETTNEELQSTNEELETTNEELQSTNEELETLNEEARSSNEEMESVNEELRIQAEQASSYRLYLESVLRSMNGGIIVVDQGRIIQSWNRWSENTWGLRSEEVLGTSLDALDIGLPLHLLRDAMNIVQTGREEQAEQMLEGMDRRGRRILCRVRISGLYDEAEAGHGPGGIRSQRRPQAAWCVAGTARRGTHASRGQDPGRARTSGTPSPTASSASTSAGKDPTRDLNSVTIRRMWAADERRFAACILSSAHRQFPGS